ncbi:hypothetical protein DFH08DRAFT_389104 [Mycena albidolilacea]|uniref:Uncharacterized protein n=1 Tax=Mycena albidolilacea TaxID=1033008 RepID=A0AAD6ZG60_9AGAR|nr:hypothetical protein DFH08DRAFT_389104 [Mycena albidolilacea]
MLIMPRFVPAVLLLRILWSFGLSLSKKFMKQGKASTIVGYDEFRGFFPSALYFIALDLVRFALLSLGRSQGIFGNVQSRLIAYNRTTSPCRWMWMI